MAQAKSSMCAPFQFLALYKAQGLEEKTDGILGLSPHKNQEKRNLHYLWSLKDNGIIDKAMISFNLATSEMNDSPYALFGDIDPSQVVGGKEGMYSFKSYDNFLGTWALEG